MAAPSVEQSGLRSAGGGASGVFLIQTAVARSSSDTRLQDDQDAAQDSGQPTDFQTALATAQNQQSNNDPQSPTIQDATGTSQVQSQKSQKSRTQSSKSDTGQDGQTDAAESDGETAPQATATQDDGDDAVAPGKAPAGKKTADESGALQSNDVVAALMNACPTPVTAMIVAKPNTPEAPTSEGLETATAKHAAVQAGNAASTSTVNATLSDTQRPEKDAGTAKKEVVSTSGGSIPAPAKAADQPSSMPVPSDESPASDSDADPSDKPAAGRVISEMISNGPRQKLQVPAQQEADRSQIPSNSSLDGLPTPSVKLSSDDAAEATTIPIKAAEPSKPAAQASAPTALGASSGIREPSVQGAGTAPVAQDSPSAADNDTYDQIVMGLKGKLDPRTGRAEIVLDPPNLGTLKVSVALENGVLTAEFQSASDVVRELLSNHLDKLKTVLQSQGVSVDRLAVGAPSAQSTAGGNQGQQTSFGSAAHDGRSAGGFQQEQRRGQERPDNQTFARLFQQSRDEPIDLVA
jgi:flagellar hook-length control protein FliK